MALMPCRECGREVSTTAATCPGCGTPTPTADPKKEAESVAKIGFGCILVGFVALIVVVMIISGGGDSESTSAPAEPARLDGSATFTGTQFVIRNGDSFDWTGCTIEVNGGLRAGYRLRAPRLASGETYTVGAMQLARPNGERFNPVTTRPNNIMIDCETPGGRGLYSASW